MQAGYRPQERIEVQSRIPFNPYIGRHHALYPQGVSISPGRVERQGKWREYGILVGLWLLVTLVAVAIGFRILEQSGDAVGSDRHGHATAGPDVLADRAAPGPSMLIADDDPFDTPLPGLPLMPAASAASLSTPTATAAAVAGASLRESSDIADVRTLQPKAAAAAPIVAPVPAARRPTSTAAMPAAVATRAPVVCSPALSAMQLCGELGN